MKNPNSKWLRFLATALCLVFWFPANPAGATVLYWDNNGTGTPSGGTWDTTSSDWATSSTLTSSPGVWNTADAAGFCAGATSAGTITISVNSTIALAGFFNGDLGQPGCYLTLSGSGSLSMDSGLQGCDTTSGSTTTVSVPITGSGGVQSEGAGTLTLSAANTYSGGTTVTAGTLQISGSGTLGSTSGALKVTGGTLDLGGTSQTAGTVTVSGGTIQNGTLTAGTSYSCSGGTISAVLAGTKVLTQTAGASTTTLSGANTFSGGVTLNGGTGSVLAVGNNSACGTGTINFNTAPTTIASTSGKSYTFANPLTLGASGTLPGPHEIFGIPGTGNLTFTGNANSGTTTDKTLEANGITVTFGGVISGSTTTHTLGFAGINGGIIVLSGANTYKKINNLYSGTVQVAHSENSGTSGPLGVWNTAGGIVFSGGTLQYSSANQYDYSPRFSTAASQAYNIDVNGQSVTFATALTSSGGTLTLSDTAGGGTLTLSSSGNTYAGGTTINAGTLEVSGSIAGNVTVNGGVLKLDNASALASTAVLTLAVSPATGAVNLSFSGSQTISALNFGASSLVAGTWGAIGSGATWQNAAFTGAGLLNVTSGGTSQTITFNNPGPQTYGVPIMLTATASSGLPVTFNVISGPASVSGSQLTFTGAGAVTVQADQDGNYLYLPAPPVNQTFTVTATNPPPLTFIVSRLQAPQIIDGPNNRADLPARAFWNGSTLSMYLANAYTYNMRGEDMRSLSEAWDFYCDTSTSLQPGTPGNFDDGGAWLIHVEVAPENTNLVRAWYHAEQSRPPNPNRKTMAYCESTDGGRTFQKVCAEGPSLGYTNNQIITAWTGYNGNTAADSAGDGRIVIVGDYYYCYFLQTGSTNGWNTHVARSLLTDHGRPGTWWKYYDPAGDGGTNGTWTQPGLGGNSSSPFPVNYVDTWGRETTWNADLNQFMIDDDAYPGLGFCGIYLDFSTDNLFNWQRSPYPLYPYEGVYTNAPNWDRDIIPAKALIAYRGFAALDGSTDGEFPTVGSTRFGTSFWWEITYLNPYEGFAERYFMRQKVTLSQTSSTAPQDQVGRVELALFRHRDNTDDWATTYNTFGHYRKIQTLGYLCSANIAGTAPIYDLTNSASQHLVSLDPTEATELTMMGYIFTNQTSGTLPLYRTLVSGIYSATTNASAPGVTGLLGYLFPPVGDETFAYRYDATEQTELINGGAELVPLTRTGQQGYQNWYFEERLASGTLIPLTYNPASASVWIPNPTQVWTSTNGPTGAMLNAYGGTPGVNSSAVRQWTAIDTGIAYVSARAFSLVAAGGAGVNVLIQKNGQLLWQSTVTNGQSSAQSVSFGNWMSVTQGDAITFEIAPLSSTSTNDNTYFKPTIWFQLGSLLSSSLVSVLHLQSNTVSVQWPSSANQVYFVESSSSLLNGAWTPVSPPILATPPTNTFVMPGANATSFYRVRLVQ